MNCSKEESLILKHQFECTCYLLNIKVHLMKFDVKTQKCIRLGYSERSKAYKIYNS